MGGSSTKQTPSQTATQVTQLPAFVQPTAQRYLNRAEALSQTPFQSYQGNRISPLNSVHNFALDQARQEFMPQMSSAATQMGNFMGGAFNEPAYIHPYLGPMLPMQSYQGISRPYPVGPGGSPGVGGGGKGGQQPPAQGPSQGPATPGPADPITGTPIDPTQPNFPNIPTPTPPQTPGTPPGPTSSLRLNGVDEQQLLEPDERDEFNDSGASISMGRDMGNFPDASTGSFAQFAPNIGRLAGALSPVPGGSLLGGYIGDSIANYYSDDTLADVYDPGYNYGNQPGSLGFLENTFTPTDVPNAPSAPEAQSFPAPELAPPMPAPEPFDPSVPGINYADNAYGAFSPGFSGGSSQDNTYAGMGAPNASYANPNFGHPGMGGVPSAPQATPVSDLASAAANSGLTYGAMSPDLALEFSQAMSGLAPGTNVSLYSGGQPISLSDLPGGGQLVAPSGINVVPPPNPYGMEGGDFADLSGFSGYGGGEDISFADIGDFGMDSDIGLGY